MRTIEDVMAFKLALVKMVTTEIIGILAAHTVPTTN